MGTPRTTLVFSQERIHVSPFLVTEYDQDDAVFPVSTGVLEARALTPFAPYLASCDSIDIRPIRCSQVVVLE